MENLRSTDSKHVLLGIDNSPKASTMSSPLVMLVDRFEVLEVTDIDSVRQRFKATLLLQLRLPGVPKDDPLRAEQELDASGRVVFPMVDGRPTFKPSAYWYMDQVELTNVDRSTLQKVDSKVIIGNEDLTLHMRFDAEFLQRMELYDFPCDTQELTISMSISCRILGKLPVQLELPSSAVAAEVKARNFFLSNVYELLTPHGYYSKNNPRIRVQLDHSGAFPYCTGTFWIRRRPEYFIYNVSVPMAAFSLLSFVQFAMATSDLADRINITLTLLLTAGTYKFVAASLTPPVSYMTAIDRHASFNALLLVLLVLGGALPGALFDDDGGLAADEMAEEEATRRELRGRVTGNFINHDATWIRDQANAMERGADWFMFGVLFAAWVYIQTRSLLWLRGLTRLPSSELPDSKLSSEKSVFGTGYSQM